MAAYSISRLGRNTMIYGLGVVISRAASFIMLPLYTRLLTPADYGLLQLLQVCVEVAVITLAAGGTVAIYRFYFKDTDDRGKRAVISTGTLLLLGSHLLAAAALAAAAPWVALTMLGDASHKELIWIAAATLALEPFTTAAMLLIQMREKSVMYVAVSSCRLVIQLSLNILFLVVLGWGVEGILISSLVTTVVFSAGLGAWLLVVNGLVPDRSLLRPMLRFGIPYRLHSAGTFITTFGDRYFISAANGLAAVGVYGLAYQFGFALISLAANPIHTAWAPQRWSLVDLDREERDRLHSETFALFNLVLITAAVGMSLFAYPLITVMSDPEFHSAARYIPLIALAQVISMWSGLAGFSAEVKERTEYIGLATWLSVGVIVICYSTLIPLYGPMGAALATVIAATTRLVAVLIFARKLWPISYGWRQQVQLLAFAGAFAGVGVAVMDGRPLRMQIALSTLFFVCFVALIWKVGLVPTETKARITRLTSVRNIRELLPLAPVRTRKQTGVEPARPTANANGSLGAVPGLATDAEVETHDVSMGSLSAVET